MMSFRSTRQFVSLAAGLTLVFAIAALMACESRARTVGTFELKDADGQAFTASRFAGQWSFLVFGYTSCPDVCPITLTELAKVYQLLNQRPDAPRNVQIVFVSVDPARDAPEDLKGFTRFFDRDIIAATGPIPELNRLTDSLGAFHRRLTEQGDEYRVEHSADVWLIDPALHLQARYAVPIKANEVVTEFLNKVSNGVPSS